MKSILSTRQALMSLTLVWGLVTGLPCQAWDDTGHQIVAFIAYHRLSPATREKVDLLLPPKFEETDFNDVGWDARGLIYSPKHLYGPFSIANWMDDLRDNSLSDNLKPWHYINVRPFFDGIPERFVMANTVNVRERIVAAMNDLAAARGFKETKPRDDNRAAAEALGFLIHLTGDVHQPLHCATRYSPQHPDGDSGGNGFKLDHPSGNLHAFWDKAGGLFHFKTIPRPFKQEGKQQLAEYAKIVTDGWPADLHKEEWKSLDPADWVLESNTRAREFAYVKVAPGGIPSEEYIQQCQAISTARLATAGYRLAAVIEKILSAP